LDSLFQQLQTLADNPPTAATESSQRLEDDDSIAGIHLSPTMASDLRAMCCRVELPSGIDASVVDILLAAEDPIAASLYDGPTPSHRLAARYPRLPLQTLPPLDPILNRRFCDMLMSGVIDHFNKWSREKGFHRQAMSRLFHSPQRCYPVRYGQVHVLYAQADQWVPHNDCLGVIKLLSASNPRESIVLGVPDRCSDFKRRAYDTKFGTAVGMLDELMKEWKPD
jgi:hypothetical protein